MRQNRKPNTQGKNHSGTSRYKCKDCGIEYPLNPKKRKYSEETKQEALKTYYSGVSGRDVGKIFGMSRANVYNWIKNETTCGKYI
jgi:transposase-like protein